MNGDRDEIHGGWNIPVDDQSDAEPAELTGEFTIDYTPAGLVHAERGRHVGRGRGADAASPAAERGACGRARAAYGQWLRAELGADAYASPGAGPGTRARAIACACACACANTAGTCSCACARTSRAADASRGARSGSRRPGGPRARAAALRRRRSGERGDHAVLPGRSEA